ncbi:hypothetical protein P4B35_03065 [Pontiellaceae bacterium B12227]|nr:hypothetical protein [Pontiellaceae bacterium B12227]
MQKLITGLALLSTTVLIGGCVNRTVSREPSNYGQSSKSKNYGATGRGQVVEEKRVWIWQKEFRNN